MNRIIMKKKQSQWRKLWISIVLLVVAIILSIVWMPLGILYTIWMIIHRFFVPTSYSCAEKTIGYLANTIQSIALWIDQIGNVVWRDLFNRILIQEDWHKFWNVHETISCVLGHNQRDKTLSKLWEKLANLLDKIEKDHCKNAIIYIVKDKQWHKGSEH